MKYKKNLLRQWVFLTPETYTKRQKKVYDEVIAYILSYAWLKQEKTKERVMQIVSMRFEKACILKNLGITEAAYKSTLQYVAKRLSEKVGESTLILLEEGKEVEALTNYRVSRGIYSLENLVYSSEQLVQEISETYTPKFGVMELKECEAELDYLRSLTKQGIEERKKKKGVDEKRMNFLLYILFEDTTRYAEEKQKALAYIKREREV